MIERRNSPAAIFSCGNVYSWLPDRSIRIAILIGSVVSRLNVKTCCGRPSSRTTTSSWRISLITRLLRSTAVNRTFTRSVPSRTASSLDATPSSLFLSCSFESGLDGCDVCELRAGGGGAFGLCAKLKQASIVIMATTATTLNLDITNLTRGQSSIGITLLVIQVSIRANQFDLDLTFFSCPCLIGWGIEDY